MIHITRQRNFAQNEMFLPWSLIVVDNVWHLIWLYIIIERGIPL